MSIEERLTWPVRAVPLGGGGLYDHFLSDHQSVNGRQAHEVENMLRRADGEVATMASTGTGRFVGGFEFFRDVSALKKP
ncbi:MAG TPA: hypothetical protein DCP92_19300 [Nitrospiraceae bacterium]|nr:hypothetical protein [Nitrospiraceae bacterium]